MTDQHLEPGFNKKGELVEMSLVPGKGPNGPVTEVKEKLNAPQRREENLLRGSPFKGRNIPIKTPRLERGPNDKGVKISQVDRSKFKK